MRYFMIKHFFLRAYNDLIKSRMFLVVNLVGLTVAMVSCSFILLWVQDEKNYDGFHENPDEIYLGISHFTGDYKIIVTMTPGLFAIEAKEKFGEVKSYCRLRSFKTGYVKFEDTLTDEKDVFAVDSTFFSFFNFPITYGLSQNMFKNPDEVVISERLSKELFGNDDPLGKTISIKNWTDQKDFHIVAVMKNFPANTWLPRADLIVHWQSDPAAEIYNSIWTGWGGAEFQSFIRLEKGTDINLLAEKITDLQTNSRDFRHFKLQPLVNLHLYSLEGEPVGIKTVWIFIWITFAILAISCINYVNLVTGRSAKKNKEVGIRKIFGADKKTLFFQLITETFVLFLLALILTMMFNELLASAFNKLSGKEIFFGWSNLNIWIVYGCLFLIVMILAGIYPALSISSFKLMNLLQKNLTIKRNGIFRKILVVVQFVFSFVLISATITLESQLTYIRRLNLGYDQEYVFTCQMRDMAAHYESVKQELSRNTAIISVTGASSAMSDLRGTNTTDKWEGKTMEGGISYYRLFADSSIFNNMAMTFVEGSGFDYTVQKFRRGTEFEPDDVNQFVINETMAKNMGLTGPIVGKWMEADYGRGRIVGVVKDFHFNSFYDETDPLVIFYIPDYANTLYIRTTAQDAGRAIAAVEKTWKEYNPNYTFSYKFMDESFEMLYYSYIVTGRLFVILSLIAVLISCMGLFGLVTYAAEAKVKEIGIRKVFGASVSDIVIMISKEFLILVSIAMLIALPLSYYWLNKLLEEFAYRISIDRWIYVISGAITIMLTLITISNKALKAARANPIKNIKTE